MIPLTATIATIAFLGMAAPTAAQSTSSEAAAHGAGTAMRTPCPLHLTTLALTPVQDTALRAIRTAHMAELRAIRARIVLPAGDGEQGAHHAPSSHTAAASTKAAVADGTRDAMRASMARATDAVRAVLTGAQRTTFEVAVAAHTTEKAERERAGTPHGCDDCCRDHAHAVKREE